MRHVYHKEDYIGAPVKNVGIAHKMHEYDDHFNHGHSDHNGYACGCGNPNCHGECGRGGICMAVVDDANNRVYLYGNIVHENYHVPGNQCIAWTGVESAGFTASGRLSSDEFFEGVQDHNTIRLEHAPFQDNTLLVFLNGVKQREGSENDYLVDNNAIKFNFYELLPTDLVEVMYTYGAI